MDSGQYRRMKSGIALKLFIIPSGSGCLIIKEEIKYTIVNSMSCLCWCNLFTTTYSIGIWWGWNTPHFSNKCLIFFSRKWEDQCFIHLMILLMILCLFLSVTVCKVFYPEFHWYLRWGTSGKSFHSLCSLFNLCTRCLTFTHICVLYVYSQRPEEASDPLELMLEVTVS